MSAAAAGKMIGAHLSGGKLNADEAMGYVRHAVAIYKGGGAATVSITAQRAQLKKAIGYAAKLSKCLQALNAETSVYVAPRKGDLFPQQYSESLDRLTVQAEQAWKAMSGVRKSAPKDPAFRELLVDLSLVWIRAFPGKYAVTRGSRGGDDHTYGGKQFEFIRAVLSAENIRHTDTGLGKRLYYLDVPWNGRRGTEQR